MPSGDKRRYRLCAVPFWRIRAIARHIVRTRGVCAERLADELRADLIRNKRGELAIERAQSELAAAARNAT